LAVAARHSTRFPLEPGNRFPPGASTGEGGINFCILSPNATAVTLNLYADASATEPLQVIELDSDVNRTFHFWHVLVVGAEPGLYYTWRVDGPRSPGMRFDHDCELVDPWARIVSDRLWYRDARRHGSIRARVAGSDTYDWEGDRPLERPFEDSIIYELHVRGFTRHPSAEVEHPGTCRGLIEKIPYLKSLGITDVELMPVFAFDPHHVPAGAAARGLRNFWGYSPYGFFALHPGYASGSDARREFRDMVKALHRAGIGVILDVVLNHTAEAGRDGVTISFKGWGNEFFYHLDADDPDRYRDYTGCGNTINCNHPLVAHFLVQCLEYWVTEMHVDGFRVDLASVLTRGTDGEPMEHAPVLWSIEFSPLLGRTHLIAEAWDAAGLQQLGSFPGFRWSQWNGRYRDTVRRFMRGDAGTRADMATRLAGSSDLFADGHPTNSINFVTCHDGFTLLDLVSYNAKHNEANGDGNVDGDDHNLSDNCGVEGPSEDPGTVARRLRRAKNFMAALMVSQGVPMVLAGDERLRTQRGNNNAYCQDNETGWVDWTDTPDRAGMRRFTRALIALRRRHPGLRRRQFLSAGGAGDTADIEWYDEAGATPNWDDAGSRILCFALRGAGETEPDLYVAFNMSAAAVELALPAGPPWQRLVDTALASPDDVLRPDAAETVPETSYRLGGEAVAILQRLAD